MCKKRGDVRKTFKERNKLRYSQIYKYAYLNSRYLLVVQVFILLCLQIQLSEKF
jgi:hypothetical protein